MKITYIHHSSFFVELNTMAMLFDYTEGDLPEISIDKPLFIFASHRHGDHYSSKILTLFSKAKEVYYILSDDIVVGQVSDELKNRMTFVKPDETYGLKGGDLELLTLGSTDEGVAFLIHAEGRVIYHAGDLNHWRWEGEPEEWNQAMARDYSTEVDKIARRKVDVAFLPLDHRQEHNFSLGFDEFMKKVEVKYSFPMHCWGDFSVIPRLKEMEVSAPYRDRIVEIDKDGQSFVIE